MDELIAKLKILLRVEKTLYQIEAGRRSRNALLGAVAVGCGLVALIFFNVGLFFELTGVSQSSLAAFILGGANLALGLIPLLIIRRSNPGKEETLLREIRELALEEVTREVSIAGDKVATVGRQIRAVVDGDAPLGEGVQTLAPLLSFVIDLLSETTADGGQQPKEASADAESRHSATDV